ncbi:hypothetical protein D3C71_1391560 [compost metagenome]
MTFGEQRGLGRQVAGLGGLQALGQDQGPAQIVAADEAGAAARNTLARGHHRHGHFHAQPGQHVVVELVATRVHGVHGAVVVHAADHPSGLGVAVGGLQLQALRIGKQIGIAFDIGAKVQRQAGGHGRAALAAQQAPGKLPRFGRDRTRRAGCRRFIALRGHVLGMQHPIARAVAHHPEQRQGWHDQQPGFEGGHERHGQDVTGCQ